jgi:hypothetical protein
LGSLSELIDQGIHAFTRGQLLDAERCWRAALELDPGNRRVQAYLKQLEPSSGGAATDGGLLSTTASGMKPVPLPEPEAANAGGGRPADSRAPASATGPATATDSSPTGSGGDPAASPWDQGPAVGVPIVLEPEGGLDFSAVAEKSDLRPLIPERARLTPHPVGPKSDVEIWMGGARELFALGDFSGSLEMIEKILKVDPNHAEAWAYLKQNESTLIAMYESKLGSAAGVPRLAIKPEEVMWLNLDHRAGFLLAQIDGTVTYEDLFALSGLPRLDTAKILATLLSDGVIR